MNHRSDCVLIQQASGEYRDLLALTVRPHLEYCLRHDIDYWPIFGEARSQHSEQWPHFDRVPLMKTALEAGYEKIIWLDADCILNWQSAEDLRGGVPGKGIGALWCASEWTEPLHYDHWCTGALYVRSSADVHDFLAAWQCCKHVEHGWQDQHAFNGLVRNLYAGTGLIKPLSRHWHAIVPHFLPAEEEPPPMVLAFHGFGDLDTRADCIHKVLYGEESVR